MDAIERSHAHVVARIRIRYSPGPVSENEQRLEKSNHHFLAGSLHDHSREHHYVIGLLRFGIGDSAAHGIGLKQHVGIGEE